ncbi:MAG: CPBP family intramembrane metalloprotease [Anaeromyxobacteraceae bacterium]
MPAPLAPFPRLAVAAAVVLAGVFALLIDASPRSFFLLASPLCLAWMTASARAAPAGLLERLRPGAADVALGLAAGAVLYLGTRLFLWGFCGGFSDALCGPLEGTLRRFEARTFAAALAIALLIAPAEELFWRGVVQAWLARRLGPARGLTAAVGLAVVLALVTGEPFLALATLPTYAAWGALAAWRGSLVPALVSHVTWSLLVASIAPPG